MRRSGQAGPFARTDAICTDFSGSVRHAQKALKARTRRFKAAPPPKLESKMVRTVRTDLTIEDISWSRNPQQMFLGG